MEKAVTDLEKAIVEQIWSMVGFDEVKAEDLVVLGKQKKKKAKTG